MTNSPRRSDQRNISVCIIAGEASGDAQGALLVKALRTELEKNGCHMIAWGSCGHLMKAAGVNQIVDIAEFGAMGFAEVVSVYPRISAAAHRLQAALKQNPPQITILIDYPGLNMRMMEDAFHLGSCVVYHIPPKVWAHGVQRVARLRDCTYLVTCILPFEEKLLRRAGVNAKFIGNPLKDEIVEFLALEQNALEQKIGLVPGSRSGEIERVFPTLVKAFVQLRRATFVKYKGVVPVANTVAHSRLESILSRVLAEENAADLRIDIEIQSGTSLKKVLAGCRYAWVCSGTAALETAMMSIPMSVVYKMHWLSYAIARRIVKLPYVSLVNLCADREIVPEFLQDDATPENLSAHALAVLNSSEAECSMRAALMALRDKFPAHSARNAAHAIVECFNQLPEETTRRFHFKSVRDLRTEELEWELNR